MPNRPPRAHAYAAVRLCGTASASRDPRWDVADLLAATPDVYEVFDTSVLYETYRNVAGWQDAAHLSWCWPRHERRQLSRTVSHRMSGQHRTEADSLDTRRILTCGSGFWRPQIAES